MLQDDQHNNRGSNGGGDDDDDDDVTEVREIHVLTSPQPSSLSLPPPSRGGRSTSSSLSIGSSDAENFTTMSREFSAMVVAGSTMQSDHNSTTTSGGNADVATANLGRIGEEEMLVEETNPLAIVPDSNPIPSPMRAAASSLAPSGSDNSSSSHHAAAMEEMSVHRVKKEEVESKIAAWQTAEIAKINNRFKREDVVINGWESEQVEKASAWLKKVERKLEERRARAVEKMQNDVAKARRKAEDKRASAEAKRGTKVAKLFELSSLLRAVGRAPSKRSFF